MPTDKKNLGEELPKESEKDLVLPYDDGTRPKFVRDLVPDENGVVLPQYHNIGFGKPRED